MAQDKQATYRLDSCTVVVDQFTLLPTSVNVEGYDQYRIDNNKIIIEGCTIGDSVTINYRTFDFNVDAVYRTPIGKILQEKERAIGGQAPPKAKKDNIIDAENLMYNGSFSRGFSIGNRQDLLLNSNFNISMYGDLGDGLKIKAAISDDNIPIQPEGNTQVLNEFDKVFIEISKDSTRLVAGDYMLQENSCFKKYIKKLKGLSVQHTSVLQDSSTVFAEGNFAISRGKYARQKINISEGNLGPYRLVGNNNERFLIILSGTERVFIDNVLQVRGFDNDYTIDYNRAEVTFAPNKFIGPENNVIIEYEYRDQNYLRSLYTARAEYHKNRWSVGADIYSEQDSKNVIGERQLDSLDVARMASVGDDLDNAFITTIYPFRETPTASTVTYIRKPLTVAGDTISYILEYNTDRNNTLVQASFTNVGQQKGRYQIDNTSTANGRVYKYVGKNQGSYEPISNLIPPIKRQMATIYGTYRNGNHSWISTDVALSNTDLNRYATDVGNDDNTGWAMHMSTEQALYRDTTAQTYLTLKGNVEIDDRYFQSFTRYREAEFNRNWNVVNPDKQLQEQWYGGELIFTREKSIELSQALQHYRIGDYFNGLRNISQGRYRLGNTSFIAQYDYMKATEDVLQNTFVKPIVRVEHLFSKAYDFKASAEYLQRKNKVKNTKTDILLDQSFGLDQYAFESMISPSKNSRLGLTYKRKYNQLSDKSRLKQAYHSDEFVLNTKIGNTNQITANVGIRNLYVDDASLSPSPEKRSLISKIGYIYSGWNKGVKSTMTFTTTSGQEPKQEIVYEKVEAGQGNYIYIGNKDSTLIAANFRYAPDLGNAEYIRLNLFNDQFIAVNNQILQQNLRTDWRKIVPNNKLLSKISTLHRLNINRKSQDLTPSFWEQFNVFAVDTSIVTYNASISNTLFVNKGQRAYDASIGTQYNHSIFTQVSGRESRKNLLYLFTFRHQLGAKSDVLLGLDYGEKSYSSSLFEDRNYRIDYYKINPSVRWIPSQRLKWAAGYTFGQQKQTINLLESTSTHAINSDLTYRYSDKSNLTASLIYSFINFDGEKNSILEFEMLSGLKKGKNFEWELLYTQRLQNNIDLNLSYRGRKSQSTPYVHMARMQLKATF